MPYGAGMAGLPGAMPGYPGMYNQAQYPAYMAAPYGLHSPYALNAMHPGYPSYPQAPPAPLARPARSVQSLECALTCSLRPLLRARLLKRGFVRDARQEGGTRGAGVQVHRAYQPYEVTKPNSLRKADLIRLSLCAGGRIRRSPERRWRGLPGRGRIRRARRRAGRGPRRAAGRQVPGL